MINYPNATSLAWIGDAIFSLYVRKHLIAQGYSRPKDLEAMQARICSARGQSAILETLEEENWLNEEEMDFVRKGRNANVRSKAKNADIATYLRATGFETLLGYLDFSGQDERLKALLKKSLEIAQ